MATVDMWSGGYAHNTARICAKVTGTNPTLKVFTAEALTGPVISVGPVAANAAGVADFAVPGLAPGGRYWCVVETNGVIDTTIKGRFRTARGEPGTPVSYTMACWTCAGNSPRFPGALPYVSNHPVLDIITDEIDPDLLAVGGDLHYLNNTTASVAPYRTAFDAVLSTSGTPRMSRHLRQISTVYQWDDHDFGPNDSDSTSPGRPFAAQAYRERVPHHPLVEATGAIYHSFNVGNVLHIVSDVRHDRSPDGAADGPTKTMLGAAQLAWMENLLATTDAKFLIWHMPSQWMGTSDDSWAVYTNERNRIVQMLKAPLGHEDRDWTKRMVQVSGDVHSLVMDDGTGNKWGGFPVLVAASVDSSSGDPQDTIYRLNGKYLSSSPGRNRFGTVSIDDDGYTITCTITGYIGRWRRFRHSFAVSTSDRPVEIPTVTEPGARVAIDFGTGPEEFEPTSWGLDREIATSITSQAAPVSGVSAASASVTIPAPPESTSGYWAPGRRIRRNSLRPLTLHADDGRGKGMRQVFEGTTDDASGAVRDIGLPLKAMDAVTRLARPVSLPAFTASMDEALHPGASLIWVIEHILHEQGMSPLPDFGNEVVVAASFAGSLTFSRGQTRFADGDALGPNPIFDTFPDLPLPTTQNATAYYSGSGEPYVGWTGFTTGCIMGAPHAREFGGGIEITLSFERPLPSDYHTHVQVGLWTDKDKTYVYTGARFVSNVYVYDVADLGQIWFRIERQGTIAHVSVIQRGAIIATMDVTPDAGFNAADLELSGVSFTVTSMPALGFQLLSGAQPIADLPTWDQDEVRADLDIPTAPITGVPATNASGIEILRAIADAEQGGFWLSEDGVPTFRNRASLMGIGQPVIEVDSLNSLLDYRWSESSTQLASVVSVDTTHPVATVSPANPPTIEVYSADQVFAIPGGATLSLEVELSVPTGQLHVFITSTGSTGSRMRVNRRSDGKGTQLGQWPGNADWHGGQLISSTRARITVHNPYKYQVYLVDTDGNPYLKLCAYVTVESTDPVAVVRETGIIDAPPLALTGNPWRQDYTATEQLAIYLAGETTVPRPYYANVQVVPNLDIKQGSIIQLKDPDIGNLDMRALVRKVALAGGPGQLTQTLEVQPLRINLGDVDNRWAGHTLGDLDDFWAGATLGDFDADPLAGSATLMIGDA